MIVVPEEHTIAIKDHQLSVAGVATGRSVVEEDEAISRSLSIAQGMARIVGFGWAASVASVRALLTASASIRSASGAAGGSAFPSSRDVGFPGLTSTTPLREETFTTGSPKRDRRLTAGSINASGAGRTTVDVSDVIIVSADRVIVAAIGWRHRFGTFARSAARDGVGATAFRVAARLGSVTSTTRVGTAFGGVVRLVVITRTAAECERRNQQR